jgi:hypothetical protein
LIALYNFMFTDMVGAKVGLALSQALIITGMLQHGLLRASEVVSLMTSVERVLDYMAIEKEPELESAPGKQTTTAQYYSWRDTSSSLILLSHISVSETGNGFRHRIHDYSTLNRIQVQNWISLFTMVRTAYTPRITCSLPRYFKHKN